MKVLITVMLMCCWFIVSAQTKLIAHRSHSGKNANFSVNSEGNFGLKRSDVERLRKQDSVAKRNDSIRKSRELPVTLITPAAKFGTIAVAKR